MSTFLWDRIVFGPIHSRRVGNSLGINLLSTRAKTCSFNCIYCECGDIVVLDARIPSFQDVASAMNARFEELFNEGVQIDSISFTGNGEPTIHPDFAAIIDKTIELRDKYFPSAVISVFSNSNSLDKQSVFDALLKIDNRIMKIDCCDESIIKLINRPNCNYSLEHTIENLERFKGDFILQTIFFKCEIAGQQIDLTSPELVEGWYKIVRRLRPSKIMAYTLDRETPTSGFQKISKDQLLQIAAPLIAEGFTVEVS